ncbi:hypothetical protein KM540_gp154 [Western grey kangaroopox virus]|uniref:Uncharacterized protein n=1 Tax=Western grey kangaroopox virus TaxID=1566307 RepID=A0A2C9DSV2_9POXV|nr:hypothetical protein KM540_gp154 [Western grey kangaroopox virus]ATI21085.1 hypothetical protein [Western grey kangaroopox virus]
MRRADVVVRRWGEQRRRGTGCSALGKSIPSVNDKGLLSCGVNELHVSIHQDNPLLGDIISGEQVRFCHFPEPRDQLVDGLQT